MFVAYSAVSVRVGLALNANRKPRAHARRKPVDGNFNDFPAVDDTELSQRLRLFNRSSLGRRRKAGRRRLLDVRLFEPCSAASATRRSAAKASAQPMYAH